MADRSRARRRNLPIAALVIGLGLVALLGFGGYQLWDAARRAPGEGASTVEFEVEGLDCPIWCAVRLTDAIDELDGAEVATWDQSAGTVVVRHDPARQDIAALRTVFERAGFPVLGARPR